MRTEIVPDADSVADSAAARVATAAAAAIARRGVFHLALAGGSTPIRLYERLGPESLDWSRTEVWFGDERAVGPDDPESNHRMARDALLGRVAPAAVHRMRGELAADEAARAYEVELGDTRMDLVLLGMGGDGHTASLFPDTPDLDNDRRFVRATTSPVPPPARITLTLRALSAARSVLFLVTGAGKRETLRRVREEVETGRLTLPAARVAAAAADVLWLTDAAAAGTMSK